MLKPFGGEEKPASSQVNGFVSRGVIAYGFRILKNITVLALESCDLLFICSILCARPVIGAVPQIHCRLGAGNMLCLSNIALRSV